MTERATAPKKLPGWVWGGVFGCIVVISWMGWNRYRPATAAERGRLATLIGGEDALRIIETAERVYATRIQIKDAKPDRESLDDFEAISEPVVASEKDRDELRRLLASPRHYILPRPRSDGLEALSACRPQWGFRLRFVASNEAITVWVCLACDRMMFVRDGAAGGGSASFRPMVREIDAIALRLFPGDPGIAQAIR